MSFLASNTYLDFFFRKEEPAPAEQPKPQSIFGGLSVKNPPAPMKKQEKAISTTPQLKVSSTEVNLKRNDDKSWKDTFKELLPSPEEINENRFTSIVKKKNDVNSIEFLLDLTLPDGQSSPDFSMKAQNSDDKPKNKLFVNDDLLDQIHSEVHESAHSANNKNQTLEKDPVKLSKNAKKDKAKERSVAKERISERPLADLHTHEALRMGTHLDSSSKLKSEPLIQAKENKFKQQIEEKKRKDQEIKEKLEIEKMQKQLEEEKRKEEISNPQGIKETVEMKLRSAKELILQITSEQHSITDIQANLHQSLEDMNSKIKELENLANEAASSEDFELAARYSDDLDSVKLKITFTLKEVEKKSEEYFEFEMKKSEVYSEQQIIISDNKDKVNSFIEIIGKSVEEHQKIMEEIECAKTGFLEDAEKQISEKTIEIKNLSQSVEEKKKDISEKIQSKTSSMQEKKGQIIASVTEIELEIEEIKRILEEKTSIMNELHAELSQINEAINLNTAEFDEEVKDCDLAEKLLNEETSSYEEAIKNQNSKKLELNEEIEHRRERVDQNLSNLETFKEALSFLEQESQTVNAILNKRQEFIDNISAAVIILKEKKELFKEAEDYLNLFNMEMTAINEDILKYREKEKELKIKIPILEIEKKNAATNKNFKVTFI